MSDTQKAAVDMSPEAVFRRLQEASDLLELCLTLGTARRVSQVERPASATERSEP